MRLPPSAEGRIAALVKSDPVLWTPERARAFVLGPPHTSLPILTPDQERAEMLEEDES
jgi:hypothetical protein